MNTAIGCHFTAGRINTGTTGTSCVINFAATWANAPFCVVSNISSVNNRLRVVTTTTTLTVTNQNNNNADDFNYICFGR